MKIPPSVVSRELGTDIVGNPTTIGEKYRELKDKIAKLYGERIWFLTDAALSAHVSCLFADVANPLALIFVGGPSTGKTTALDLFEGLPMSYRIDKFTPASFQSQATNVRKDNLEKIDLLPKIVYKVMLVPELAPLFNQPKEVLMQSYALLARLLDGTGLVTAGAVHGVRRSTGDYMFGLLGATTPLSQTAWNTMGKVGARLLFLITPARLSKKERRDLAMEIMTSDLHYKKKKKLGQEAIRDFLLFLFKQHEPEDYTPPEAVPEHLPNKSALLDHCGYLPRTVEWDRLDDNSEVVAVLSLVAEFLTAGRREVRAWTEKTNDGRSEMNSSGVVNEGVERFSQLIYNLARCHALVAGRKGIDWDDLPLVLDVAMSSLPDDRRKAVELLVDGSVIHKESPLGEFTIEELVRSMSCTDKTAKTIMDKLQIIGLGKVEKGVGSIPTTFKLDGFYDWFCTEEFSRLYRKWDIRS